MNIEDLALEHQKTADRSIRNEGRIKKLEEGYDFIQGSRFIEGGQAINTPISRHLAVKFIHAPVISFTAKEKFTDTK